LNATNLLWSKPTGGGYVKNYVTNDNEGIVVKHNDPYDYQRWLQFDYYYTNKFTSTDIGSISCGGFTLTDPNGIVHLNLVASTAFFIETPTVTSFSSVFASWDPAENAVGVRPLFAGMPDALVLGGTPGGGSISNKGFSPGITWTANVTAPPVIGGGEIAYNQQVCVDDWRRFYDGEPLQRIKAMGMGVMLDLSFPYGRNPVTGINEFIKPVGTTLVSWDTPSVGLARFNEDGQFFDKYTRKDTFKTYLIYQPEGTSTIWVTLSVISWGWSGTAVYNNTGSLMTSKWELDTGSPTGGGNGTLTSFLPEWDKCAEEYIKKYVDI